MPIRALPMRQPSQEPLSTGRKDDEPQPAIVAVPQPFRQRVRRADRARRAGRHPGVRPMKPLAARVVSLPVCDIMEIRSMGVTVSDPILKRDVESRYPRANHIGLDRSELSLRHRKVMSLLGNHGARYWANSTARSAGGRRDSRVGTPQTSSRSRTSSTLRHTVTQAPAAVSNW